MAFITYENRKNPRVTIHLAGCGQIAKNGGTHKYGQGAYREHLTYADAGRYAENTGLRVIVCSYCKPASQHSGTRGTSSFRIPEEVGDESRVVEGRLVTVLVNAYERSDVARARCIDHYGLSC